MVENRRSDSQNSAGSYSQEAAFQHRSRAVAHSSLGWLRTLEVAGCSCSRRSTV